MTENEKGARGRHRADKGKKPKGQMPIEKVAAGITSQIRAYERRCVADPEGLAYMDPIRAALQDVARVAIATHRQRGKMRQPDAIPLTVIADLMGISKPMMTKYADAGDEVIAERVNAAGVVKFPEAFIDRQRRQQAAAEADQRTGGYGNLRAIAGGRADDSETPAARTGTDG